MTVFNGTPTNDSLPGAGQDFSGDNTIRGLAGNDTINAGTGNDIVEGGAGNDWLDGGAGRDTADYSYVTVNMAATLQAEGQTTTISISTVTGAEDIDRLTNIENLAGGLGNDSLTGNDAANVLSGGSGNDTLSGGAGGQDTLIGGTGIDTAVFVGGAVVVALDRHGNATASGGDTDVLVGIENLTGSASGSDRLSGNASDNVLIGLGGNDVLLGGGGNDTLTGGTGNDVLTGDGLNLRTEQYRQDTFVFVAGGGNDTIADFGLGTGVQARDKLDFKAFGWTAGDLKLTTENTAGLTEAAFNADNNIKIALIQRTSLTEDWRFMYRDGEGTATLTIKHANQNIVWSATDHFIFT